MDYTTNGAPGSTRPVRRGIQVQQVFSANEDPITDFFLRHSGDYEALERHQYAALSQVTIRYPQNFRGDVESDEAFSPLNYGLRRR
jgi:hypothetical protein